MMRLRVTRTGQGSHPSEVVVEIITNNGPEEVVVHERSIKDNSLEIGYPVDVSKKEYLVELPRETLSGSWRVWVSQELVF